MKSEYSEKEKQKSSPLQLKNAAHHDSNPLELGSHFNNDRPGSSDRGLTLSERIKALNERGLSDNKQPSSQFTRPPALSKPVVNIKSRTSPVKTPSVITTAVNTISPVNQSASSIVSSEKPLASGFNRTTPSTLTVGKYELELTHQENVVVFRGDNRDPETIAAAGGFYPWSKQHVSRIKSELTDAFIKDGPSAHMIGHVRSPNKNYVSTGMNMDSGGFGEQSAYLYKMEIPGLKPQEMNKDTIGQEIRQDKRGINYPHFLMSHPTLQQSEFVAMIPARTEELTFITPIPLSYITSYKKKGTNTWNTMPGTR
ncbi:hypothetical protein [Photorhabdus caribbeanensis]|uniref:hypothetical protein n=1 Tax=Photorhabdus caribbeanensis TaxID=1004165 RepID=UPI001BD6D635|nr:hypothetical protein [Photorhabdus caribbeanensis]MBS9423190.1 hypothetical protein [Photorhabdus caribbeanensis]